MILTYLTFCLVSDMIWEKIATTMIFWRRPLCHDDGHVGIIMMLKKDPNRHFYINYCCL